MPNLSNNQYLNLPDEAFISWIKQASGETITLHNNSSIVDSIHHP